MVTSSNYIFFVNLYYILRASTNLGNSSEMYCGYKESSVTKSFYYKEIQKEKKETGKVERALAIPDLMLGRYTVSLPTFPLHSYEP